MKIMLKADKSINSLYKKIGRSMTYTDAGSHEPEKAYYSMG